MTIAIAAVRAKARIVYSGLLTAAQTAHTCVHVVPEKFETELVLLLGKRKGHILIQVIHLVGERTTM